MVAVAGPSALPNAKRIVVKVGSALLIDEDKKKSIEIGKNFELKLKRSN